MAFTKQKQNYNNAMGTTPKVDAVIIYSLMKLTNVASQPYLNQTERKYKYYQMRDLMISTIAPYLIPKVNKDKWAKRYYTLVTKLEETQKIEYNLNYFNYLITEMMQLLTTILYSTNYYMMEDYNDAEYEQIIESGGEVYGA
jgi:hypothetical protein